MSRWLVFLAVAIVALAAQQTALAVDVPATPVDPVRVRRRDHRRGPHEQHRARCGLRSPGGAEGDDRGHARQRQATAQLECYHEPLERRRYLFGVGGSHRRWLSQARNGAHSEVERWRHAPEGGGFQPRLGSLTGLVTLNLHWNALRGPIPSELGDLPNLETLILSHNGLSGQIPPEIGTAGTVQDPVNGNIPGLHILDLAGNNLSGAIPSEIWKLTELRELLLYGNRNINGGTGSRGRFQPRSRTSPSSRS